MIDTKIYLDTPPDNILKYLSEKNITPIAAAFSDLSDDGTYQTVWVVATKTSVCMFIGNDEDGVWKEKLFAKYDYSEIQRFRIDTFLTSGILIGEFDETDFELCAFSNNCSRKFGHLANLLNKLKSGDPLRSEDTEFDTKTEYCPTCGCRYMDIRLKLCPKCMKPGALFRRVMSYGKKYKWQIALVFFTLLLSSVIALVRPQLGNRVLFDYILNPASPYHGRLGSYTLAVLFLELCSFAVSLYNGRLGAKISAKIIYDIKLELFSAMQNLSLSFFHTKHVGNLMTRINNDAQDIQYFLNDGIPHFIMNLINLIGILIIMLMHSPMLALFVFLPVPIIIYFIKTAIPKFKKYKWNAWAKRSRINSIINDVLTGMRVVKAFGREGSEVKRFETANSNLYNAAVQEGTAAAKTFPFLSYIMTIGGLFVWGIGGYSTINGNMTFGMLMTFIGYLTMIYGPIDFMMRTFDWYTNCMNASQRIFEIIDQKSEIIEPKNPIDMPNIKGDILIEDVTFEYEPNKPVLHNINLDIKAGEMIGLVGHSGAGKSTITNLITRLYDVNDGRICIDGINIKDIKTSDLRSQIGMVLQDTFLFSGTLAENIAYARPDATREEIITAAKLANAHDFIMRMSDGYETMIGRRKNNLSGGEKQRISIARAILVNPRILILDEATASVDTETERLIQEALERLVKGRTTIAIAHRLSTLRNADRLVVIEHGTIAEVGTHEELEKNGGIYYDMLKIQKEALKIHADMEEIK